ncbi:hypothetical protein ACFQU2_11945 [Siccirubricoccus deserti]
MPSDTGLPVDDGKRGRLPPIPPEAMTPEQKRVADGITGGPRGGLRGPFPAMLRSRRWQTASSEWASTCASTAPSRPI